MRKDTMKLAEHIQGSDQNKKQRTTSFKADSYIIILFYVVMAVKTIWKSSITKIILLHVVQDT